MNKQDRPEAPTRFGRRGLLATSAMAAAFASLGAGLAGSRAAGAQAGPSDPDILNFALNLEYLEAEFYLRAATGTGLPNNDVGGTGTPGQVMGGRKVHFQTKAFRLYAEEIAHDEAAHVRFLRSALGVAAVARPAIDLDMAFTAAARAAGAIGPRQKFDAFANERNFLLAAYLFEDVGVTAYKGAAPLITDKGVLEAAAGILAVEAYHAGEIRTILYSLGLFRPAQLVSDARDSLDGPEDKDQGIGDRNTANIVLADQNAIAFSRSPTEVLNIVYLNPQTQPGGFFPNGVNGVIA
jgi:Ferritin-like domain